MIVLFVFIGTNVFAQDDAKIITAFTNSYALETKGDFAKAVDIMKGVYDEKSYEINLRLGWLYYSSGLFSESMTYYQKSMSLLPYSEEAKFGLVYPAAALGKWELVEATYKQILDVNPQNTTAGYKLGLIYYGRKNYDAALKLFKKVVDLYPFSYDALIMLAWTNFQLGKLREAKVLFNKVLMLSPTDTSAKEGLGLIK